VITEEMLRAVGPVPEAEFHRQKVAEYRHIKRRVIADMRSDDASRFVLIASALAGEGKSFCAVNLALSLALEPDYAVLLIDADVIKPNLSRRFGLVGKPGLLDAATDPALDVESVVLSTNIEGLSVLPAGRPHENATEHFASARMQQLMQQLLQVPNRIVVVDGLPLLLTTEARVLAPLAGQVLLVVRAESTPQSAVMQALSLLGQEVNVKLILNAVVRNRFNHYYGYGYSYDYGAATKGDQSG
jgi:receptor protein-tyrosine kinase